MGPTSGTQAAGPLQCRAVRPEYVGCTQLLPPLSENCTPVTPAPGVNGQVAR
ncbi:MAG: hypothetical protein ACRDPK_04695 [Carbonactinosporaceae bacterium]